MFLGSWAADMPGSTLQRECCGGSVSVSATPKTKWRSGKGGAVVKYNKGLGKAETDTSVLFFTGFSISRSRKLHQVPFAGSKWMVGHGRT